MVKHNQTIRQLIFDHFVGLALRGLKFVFIALEIFSEIISGGVFFNKTAGPKPSVTLIVDTYLPTYQLTWSDVYQKHRKNIFSF